MAEASRKRTAAVRSKSKSATTRARTRRGKTTAGAERAKRGKQRAAKGKRSRRPREQQLEMFPKHRHGGARPGSGPKPKPWSGVPHDRRERFKDKPVHVTLKLVRDLRGLRHAPEATVVRDVLRACREREGFRIVHYSIQWDHVHLIVEALDEHALGAGMKPLCIRLARNLNRHWGRKGRVLRDRYHAEVLRSPEQTRNALRYVLCNGNKHRTKMQPGPDPLSSGKAFDRWNNRPRPLAEPDPSVLPPARWHLCVGWWTHHPLFSTEDVPEESSRKGYASARKAERRRRRQRRRS